MSVVRKKFDWEAIEKDYRMGQKSLRVLGREYDISPSAISRRARLSGWQQDRSAEIAARTKAAVLASRVVNMEAANAASIPATITDLDIEKAVQTNVRIIREHRKDIAKLAELERSLMNELRGSPTKVNVSQYQGTVKETIVPLSGLERSIAVNNVAAIQHKRISLERQAFNINDDDGDKKEAVSFSFNLGGIDG